MLRNDPSAANGNIYFILIFQFPIIVSIIFLDEQTAVPSISVNEPEEPNLSMTVVGEYPYLHR